MKSWSLPKICSKSFGVNCRASPCNSEGRLDESTNPDVVGTANGDGDGCGGVGDGVACGGGSRGDGIACGGGGCGDGVASIC